MKTIVFIIGALMTVATANAGEYSHYSRINFQSASTFVPSNKVCRNGSTLFHKTKEFLQVTICDDGGTDCRTETRRLEQPVVSTAKRCAKYVDDNCVAYEMYTLKQGPTATVSTYASYNDFEDGRTPLATKKFALPACK